MNLNTPTRYSRTWWIVIGATTIITGLTGFLILTFATKLETERLLVYLMGLTAAGDVIVALSMEAVAPTRVAIGPGDRRFKTDQVNELADVISGFNGVSNGLVRIRGETWRARQAETDHAILESGSKVRILERDGLTLVVSSDAS